MMLVYRAVRWLHTFADFWGERAPVNFSDHEAVQDMHAYEDG
jgi:hypothetical protein